MLSFVTIVTIIASANMFGQSYLITHGAPGNETRTAIYYIADTGLRNFQMGDAAAMSYVLTIFLMLLSVVVFWLFRERKDAMSSVTQAAAGTGVHDSRPTTVAGSVRQPARAQAVLRYVLLVVLALLFISPLVFMLVTSFKTRVRGGRRPADLDPQPADHAGLQQHPRVPSGTPVLRWFANSLIAAAANAVLVVVTAALAAYPLARMRVPRPERRASALIIATLFVPPVILIIPNYLIVGRLKWLDTASRSSSPRRPAPSACSSCASSSSRCRRSWRRPPVLDGANRFQIFTQVVLPLSRPALVTLAVLAFLTNWNDFLWPVYVLFSPETQTLPAGLSTLQSANNVRYDLLMAGAVIASVPVLILYCFAQRFIIEGVSRSGLKG